MLLLGGKRLLITKQLLKIMSAKEGKKDKRRGKDGARTTGCKVNNNKNSSDKIKMFWVAFRWAELIASRPNSFVRADYNNLKKQGNIQNRNSDSNLKMINN